MPSLSVLVVDDIESVRHLMRGVLEHAGHRVLEAGDGFEVLACLAENPGVELVITDLRMPNMDGGSLPRACLGECPGYPSCSCRGSTSTSHRTRSPGRYFPSRLPPSSSRRHLAGIRSRAKN